LITPNDGFLNCTVKVADSPGARLDTPGTVEYGNPPKLPVPFANVTPLVSPTRTTWKGPLIVAVLTFVMVIVPLNVWFTRLKASPDPVAET
jgi:hypothetical protein